MLTELMHPHTARNCRVHGFHDSGNIVIRRHSRIMCLTYHCLGLDEMMLDSLPRSLRSDVGSVRDQKPTLSIRMATEQLPGEYFLSVASVL